MAVKRLSFLLVLLCMYMQIVYTQDENKSKPEEDIQFIKKRGYSVDACFNKAEDYLKSSTDQYKAVPYLEYIIETDKIPKPKVYYMLSQAYYYNGNYSKAVNSITEYINKEKDGQQVKAARIDLERFKNAEQIAKNPLNVVLVNLGPDINSKFSEVNPYVSKDEGLLVYSSNRSKNYDIYVSKKANTESKWGQPKLAGNYVNSVNDDFVAGLSSDGQKLMVHYNQVSGYEDINVSCREKGVFRELTDPGQKINSTYREEGACLTENGDTMFFASDRPGGFGGFDLYYSIMLPDGTYGTPINMGETINTKFDENYPNLSPDGSKLYFASKGHNSIGGYDIFYTSLGPVSKTWSEPINIGYPINNAYDNKTIGFSNDPRYAYISTVDWRTYGDYDLYKVIFLDAEPGYVIVRAEVFANDGDAVIPFNKEDKELKITVYQNGEIYGKYSFDKRNNSIAFAFIPGTYVLEIESEGFNSYRKKITIDENYYINNQRSLKVNMVKKQ
jgi:hypothetical protein